MSILWSLKAIYCRTLFLCFQCYIDALIQFGTKVRLVKKKFQLTILRKKAEFARSDGKARNPGEVARINRRLALFDIQALSLDHNSLVQLPDLVLLFTRLAMLTVSHNQLEALSVPPQT